VKKVAANTKPFLLQTCRRDMGGGKFVLMKDLSSPICIRGRHWGAFRMGFRQSSSIPLEATRLDVAFRPGFTERRPRNSSENGPKPISRRPLNLRHQ
jgi:hypothetical protein